MKKILASKYFIIITSIVMLAYNIVLFLCTKEPYSKTFWVIYAFVMFAFLVLLLTAIFTRGQDEMGVFPAVAFSGAYLVIVLLICTVMFFFSNSLYVLTAFLPLFIITVIFVILVVFSFMQKAWIKKNPQKLPELFAMSDVLPYVEQLILKASEPNVIKELTKVKEDVINAKVPAEASADVENVEKLLYEHLAYIRKNIERNEKQNIYNNINKVRELIAKRDQLIR